MARKTGNFWQRLTMLVGSTILGLVFLVASTYLWWPPIIPGLIIIILGYLLSDELWWFF